MFLPKSKKIIRELNEKLEPKDIQIIGSKKSEVKGVTELQFGTAPNRGQSIGFLINDDKGYISSVQFFERLLFPLIYEFYSRDNYPQLVIIVANELLDNIADELSDKHLFPICELIDDSFSLIIVRKKDIISYYDKNKKDYENSLKSREKSEKLVEKTPSTLPTTFSNIYTKLPVIILSITFICLFVIFFYDNFVNMGSSESKPKVERNKVFGSYLKEIGNNRSGNEKLIGILLTNKDIPLRFIIRHAKDSDIFTILQNKNTPRQLIQNAINSDDENYRVAVSLNTTLTNDEMMKLANDKSLLVRSNLATNPKLPKNIMMKLAKDSLTVQDALFENTSLTDDILKSIIASRVIDCGLNRKIFASHLTTSSKLSYYKDSEDICIREGIASNRSLPHTITEYYIDSKDQSVRRLALANGQLSESITDRYFNRSGSLPESMEQNIAEERALILTNPNLDKSIYERVVLDAPYTDGLIVAKRDVIDNETLSILIQFADSYLGVDNFIQESRAILYNTDAIIDVIKNNSNDQLAIIRYIKREVNYRFIRNIYDPYRIAVILSKYKIYADYDNLSYINFNDIDISLDDNDKKLPINFVDNSILVDRLNLLDKSEKITFETIKLADNITYSTTVYLLPMVRQIMIDNNFGDTRSIDEFLSKTSGGSLSSDEEVKEFIIRSLEPLNSFYE